MTSKREVGDLTELALHVSDCTEFPGSGNNHKENKVVTENEEINDRKLGVKNDCFIFNIL